MPKMENFMPEDSHAFLFEAEDEHPVYASNPTFAVQVVDIEFS
jgi:hypothetical protein